MLTGCASSPQPPAVGVWELSNVDEISAESTTLHLGVVRLECSGGKTGTVLDPEVTNEKDRIVIRTDVEPLQEGAYTCLGNDTVPLTVELSEPVGQRELVDAACLQGRAVTTTFCTDHGVRWSPQQEE
ncbi:hypothetical protein [Cryobacterium sp. BB307]|uniref:hypothetical protein n=1 Tax=Cryobacterium sp. BB307 TaxID=2716317 RepID=UPI0014477B2E|nr:hypothetical protein [Cryobacterium sp. BB307]